MKIEYLIGKRLTDTIRARDYADWAESLINEGYDSKNIVMLLAIGMERNPDTDEIEIYFQRCLSEVGYTLPSEIEAYKSYAKLICKEIIDDEIEPRAELGILASLTYRSDDESSYYIWLFLEEDVLFIDSGWPIMYNEGLTKENIDEYIINAAREFLITHAENQDAKNKS